MLADSFDDQKMVSSLGCRVSGQAFSRSAFFAIVVQSHFGKLLVSSFGTSLSLLQTTD